MNGVCLDVFRKIFLDYFLEFYSLKEFTSFIKSIILVSKSFHHFIKNEYLVKYSPIVHLSVADIKKDINRATKPKIEIPNTTISRFVPVYFGIPVQSIKIIIPNETSRYMLQNHTEKIDEFTTTYSFGIDFQKSFPHTLSMALVLKSCKSKPDLYYRTNFRFYFPEKLNTKTSSITLYSEITKSEIETLSIDSTLISKVDYYHIYYYSQ